ncbi:MAG TPA: RpiB/LacA/LacB family sugar-phosphate isomerase [Vicinamibacterales bacterium]|nr:RpiB/LacA/LacB family sugar-phosphate isomerase [Vicinamibacterales bacterium]
MKRFEIITEADARVLTPGDAVMLAKGGHITPLAQDTLADRRVTVVHEGRASADDQSLVPVADIRSIAIAGDHTAVKLRRMLAAFLRSRGLAVNDLGTDGSDPVDYPDVAASVGRLVARGEADAGIVIDGAGIGSAIAANKIAGIRAVMATTETIARYARAHNGANVLTLGATLVSPDEARAIVVVWLETAMREPRYIRRLAKIRDLESK